MMRINLILVLLCSTHDCVANVFRKFINASKFTALFIAPCSISVYGFKTGFDTLHERDKKYSAYLARFKALGGRNEPIGIANTYGTCYASATLQLLEAAHAAQPDAFDSLISTTDEGIIGAYKKTRQSLYHQPQWNFMGIIDPTPFVEEWKRQNPHQYGTWVRKKVQNADGSMSMVELYPDRANKAIGGRPEEIVGKFIMECDKSAQASKAPPLLALIKLGKLKNNLPMALNHADVLDKERAKFLLVHNNYREQFVPSLDVQTFKKGCEKYRLTAVIQCIPRTREEGVCFNSAPHVICYARYREQWFKCDDYTISSISQEKLHAELDEDARTTYEGGAQQRGHWLGNPYPSLLLYVQV